MEIGLNQHKYRFFSSTKESNIINMINCFHYSVIHPLGSRLEVTFWAHVLVPKHVVVSKLINMVNMNKKQVYW